MDKYEPDWDNMPIGTEYVFIKKEPAGTVNVGGWFQKMYNTSKPALMFQAVQVGHSVDSDGNQISAYVTRLRGYLRMITDSEKVIEMKVVDADGNIVKDFMAS